MKKIFAAVSAIGLLASTPAFAQSTATGEILLNATVAPQCGAGNHLSGAASATGWEQGAIAVNLTNAGNGQFSGQTETTRSFGNVWCNNAATVTLEVAALRGGAATTDTSSFTNRFDVSVVTDAAVYAGGTQGQTISTVGDADGVVSITGNSGQAFETGLQRFGGANSITILADAGGSGGNDRRATAGSYAGYLRFTATTN